VRIEVRALLEREGRDHKLLGRAFDQDDTLGEQHLGSCDVHVPLEIRLDPCVKVERTRVKSHALAADIAKQRD
jgi:hypothetical protein